MRFLKGIGIWFLSAMGILFLFTAITSIFNIDKDKYLLWYQGAVFFIPIIFAAIFSKKKIEKNNYNSLFDFNPKYKNQVIIARKGQLAGSAYAHKVYFDGNLMGTLRPGKKIIIGTFPGKHCVYIKGFWKQENSIEFYISENQEKTYVFDELDIWKSNIKLGLIAFTDKNETLTKFEIICNEKENLKLEKCADTYIIIEEKPQKEKYIPIKERDPMEIIRLMEKRFETQYQFAYKRLFNLHDCQKIYEQTVAEFNNIELPLAAQVRFEQLCVEYKEKFNITNPFVAIDGMEGHAFEKWCAELLRRNGYIDVKVTPGSGDQGVDVIAVKEGIRYAIQCKCYSSDLGNKPVQEVHAGKDYYDCDVAVVMTNQHFTVGAKELAAKTKVRLWDREKLEEMIKMSENKEED